VLDPNLNLNGVTFAYGRGRPVLSELTLEFTAGATLLLGPNGAGKSTLLGLCASTLSPRRGLVAANGTPAAGADLRAFRSVVSLMPQQIQSVPGLTVREQVAYAGWLKGMSKQSAWERSLDCLSRVDLVALADRRPRTLSGGELRRVGVAQAIVHGAEWLLLDEPTAGLDPAQRAHFQELIGGLRREVNIVISTHQTEDIGSSYEAVLVLNEGRVTFTGTTEDFLARGDGAPGSNELVVSSYLRALESSPASST